MASSSSSSRYASMAVLPYEEYLELRHQQPHLSPLEKKYEKVVNKFREHANIDNPIEQQMKQGQDLDEMRLLKEKMNKHYFKNEKQTRGSQLLSFLSPSVLEFNSAGEVTDKRTNTTIHGSRIDDLINYAVDDGINSISTPPTGWTNFISILKSVPHIPQQMLNSYTTHELASFPSFGAPTFTASPPPSFATSSPPPPSTKKRQAETPAHLHRPRTRAKAKRSMEAKVAVNKLLGRGKLTFQKF